MILKMCNTDQCTRHVFPVKAIPAIPLTNASIFPIILDSHRDMSGRLHREHGRYLFDPIFFLVYSCEDTLNM